MNSLTNNTRRYAPPLLTTSIFIIGLLLIISLAGPGDSVSFRGIPAAFGDLDLNKRTDIVVIGDDGKKVDIYYQHQRQVEPPLELGFSCRSEAPIVQVYLTDIDNDGYPNLLPLILDQDGLYSLKSLKVKTFDPFNYPYPNTKLSANTAYSLLVNAAALKSDASNSSSTTVAAVAEPLKSPNCEFLDLDVRMKSQPLLFDLKGELKTDFMSLDKDGAVAVWRNQNSSEKPIVRDTQDWTFIPTEYFKSPHANAFIDMNHDHAADIVLSSPEGKVAYLYANKDRTKSFREINRELNDRAASQNYRYGQSSLVDIDADGKIDHVLPRCHKNSRKCEMIVLYDNSRIEVIFNFTSQTEANNSYDYRLEEQTFATNYLFPITLRAADLDGDGYTDFVTVVRSNKDYRSKLIFLHNIPNLEVVSQTNIMGSTTMARTFDVIEIPSFNPNLDIHLVSLFDINEDGKIDLLIGECDSMNKPSDLNVTARMNSQMVDACFMKVLVTNGGSSDGGSTNGQSAHGPFVCFELSQNDGRKLQGCSGQLSQASYFALQPPFVIFGLGQTPHFVETLNVSIPGFGPDGKVRTRLLEQIVPDAQVIIIPRDKDTPSSWDYKMFLSPMSDLVFSTLIALAVLCLIILFIIFILHRQETLEDAAEHEEYKRHWPESR